MRKGAQIIYKEYLYSDSIEKWPKWLDVSGILFNRESYDGTFFATPLFALNEHATMQEVDIFLGYIIDYNHLSDDEDRNDFGFTLTDEPKSTLENLLEYINRHPDYMVDPDGGLILFEGDKEIFFGCCEHISGGLEVIEEILNKKSPCTGHYSWIGVEFVNDSIIVLANVWVGKCENPRDNIANIEFSETELHALLHQAKRDVMLFLQKPFKQRLTELHAEIADELTQAVMEWFGVADA